MKKKRILQLAAASAMAAAVLTGSALAAPAYIISPSSVDFDEAFDGQGKAPAATTFQRKLSQEDAARTPSVSADTTLADVQKGYIDSASIVLHCVLDTQEKAAWFQGLNQVQLRADDGEGVIGALTFRTTRNGTDGMVIVQAPQKNLLERTGTYVVSLASSASDVQVLTSVSLVDASKVPVYNAPAAPAEEHRVIMNQMPPHLAGKNLSFQIPDLDEYEGEVEVYLTRPDGKTVKLPQETGYRFTLGIVDIYGTDTESGVTYTPYSGVYQLTLNTVTHGKATPYAVKKFRVESGAKAPEQTRSQSQIQTYDAISTASIGGGGSSGGGGGLSGWPGYVIFDEDLLSNALILKEIGQDNWMADNVVRAWETYGMTAGNNIAVMEGGLHMYSMTDFLDRAMDASVKGEALTFDAYRPIGEANGQYMYGILDTSVAKSHFIQSNGSVGEGLRYEEALMGREAPTFTSEAAVTAGKDLVLTCHPTEPDDSYDNIKDYYVSYTAEDYLNHVFKVFLNNEPLEKSDYSVDAASGTLTIRASALTKTGDLALRLYAKGYQESNTTLQTGQKVGEIALRAEGEHALNTDVTIQGLTPQFVARIDRSGILLNNRYLSRDDYAFSKDGKSLTLKAGLFQAAGEYKLSLTAEGYDAPITVTFTVEGQADLKTHPEATSIQKTSRRTYLEVNFDREADESYAYTQAVYAVTVNGKPLRLGDNNVDLKVNQFCRSGTNQLCIYGDWDTINTVTIQATGYDDWSFNVTKWGDLTDLKPGDTLPTKTVPEFEVDLYSTPRLTFTNGSSYVEAIENVTIETLDGTMLEMEPYDGYFSPSDYDNAYQKSGNRLVIGCDQYEAESKYKITISAANYEDLVLTLRTDYAKYVTSIEKGWDGKADELPTNVEPPRVYRVEYDSYWDDDVKFDFDAKCGLYFNKIERITLNGNGLEKADYSTFSNSANNYLEISEEKFQDGENTIVITTKGSYFKKATVTVTKNGSSYTLTSTTTDANN